MLLSHTRGVVNHHTVTPCQIITMIITHPPLPIYILTHSTAHSSHLQVQVKIVCIILREDTVAGQRQRQGQTDKQANRRTDRQRERRERERQTDRQTDLQTDRGRQTGSQTDRQTEAETDSRRTLLKLFFTTCVFENAVVCSFKNVRIYTY